MEKYILHGDMNNFYASVECMLNPSIKNKPVVVCGSAEDRHGIVLAKNYIAKQYNINVGDTIWKAKQQCPDIAVVSPPNFNEYKKYSKLAHEIYNRFTEYVEPYGMDECWLDISESVKNMNEAKIIADKIRNIIKFELGLTISVGVSFNKIFAKLGSDLKKPNATIVIDERNYKTKIFPLPIENLFGVGRNTKKILDRYLIKTIGDLANEKIERIEYLLGQNGRSLYLFANGLDDSSVSKYDDPYTIKSVSHGITTIKDMENNDDVWEVLLSLSQFIGFKLRCLKKRCYVVNIIIRDNLLIEKQWQKILNYSIQSSYTIAKEAFNLFISKYKWQKPLRSVTIQVSKLQDEDSIEANNLFIKCNNIEKIEKVEKCIDNINKRFGNGLVINTRLLKNNFLPNSNTNHSFTKFEE